MSAPYNFTNITEAESFTQVIKTVNLDGTGGLMGVAFFISIFLLILLVFAYKHGIRVAFATASYICTLLGFLFWLMDLITDKYVWLVYVCAAFAIASLVWQMARDY